MAAVLSGRSIYPLHKRFLCGKQCEWFGLVTWMTWRKRGSFCTQAVRRKSVRSAPSTSCASVLGTSVRRIHCRATKSQSTFEDFSSHGPPSPNPIFQPPTAAYIHIPFCRRRCHYCDFPITTVGLRGDANQRAAARMADYVALVSREIQATAACAKQLFALQQETTNSRPPVTIDLPASRIDGNTSTGPHSSRGNPGPASPHAPLATVFFGGGTPSLLPPPLLASLTATLHASLGVSSAAEVSMEADPGTFDLARLRAYVAHAGVTRVSVGVQALSDETLKACGRTHSVEEAEEALRVVQQAGVQTWSADLMSGLPHQTLASWDASLRRLLPFCPPHLSLYDLQVEPGTAFARWYAPSTAPLPSDSAAADMYRHASHVLRSAGYHHYEVSNYAAGPEHYCRHNLTYWTNRPYYGFGLGATSYLGGRRVSRPRDMAQYAAWVQNLEASGGGSLEAGARVDGVRDQVQDTVMLGLRLAKGLSLKSLRRRFGDDAALAVVRALQPFVKEQLVEMVKDDRVLTGSLADVVDFARKLLEQSEIPGQKEEDVSLRLADPNGFLVSNDVISSVFCDIESLEHDVPMTAKLV